MKFHIITNLRGNVIVIIDFQLKTNNKFEDYVNYCYGVTKDPNENDYLLVFGYAKNGDLHNYLSRKFLGSIKFVHFGIFYKGKFIYTY